ncbi:hypothetical protein GOODEAATRI_020334 [Goodea atripinnis]|uniref:Ribosomal protein L2 n=1 Tax=Goodea atripinnis TaxID=208336 RepID=A0ABV0P6E8_9TELE
MTRSQLPPMRRREVREGYAVTFPTGGSSAAVRDDQRGGRRLIAACDTRQHHGTYRIKGGGRRKVAGHFPRDGVRIAAPPHREKSIEVPRTSALEASWTPPSGGFPDNGPGHAGGTVSLGWPGNALEELEEVSGKKEVWVSLLRLVPPRPSPK